MKFGPVDPAKAEGTVLAHSVSLPQGRLRKGKMLTGDDVTMLAAAGIRSITVATLGPDDLGEDEAAEQLAQALAGTGVRLSRAATGRTNLFATGPGVVQLERAAIDAVNAVNPMITVATVPQFHRSDADAMIATVKIISYAVARSDVEQACKVAEGALSLLAPRYATACLVETTMGDTPPPTKGEEALRGRLERLGLTLAPRTLVPHRTAPLSAAIAGCDAEMVFVLTASATSDVADVGPAALIDAGGTLAQFGMPVDPGNLLFLGSLGDKPVIGLPGCARSPALNGADWVLERVICGVPPTPADFARMGVGGLLKEIPTRPQPRAAI